MEGYSSHAISCEQVTPDLMLKLTKDSQPSKEGVKPKRPAQRAPARRPRLEVPAETRGSGSLDIPKPFYPPFLSSLPGMHESTDHKKDLVPIYKVLEETVSTNWFPRTWVGDLI